MDLRFAMPPGAPGQPAEGPDTPAGPWSQGVPLSAPPPPPPPVTAAGSRQYVKRVDDLTPRGNTFTQEVAQRINSLIYRGELRYVADDAVERRWALDPTASPFWPGGTGGLTGTFTSGKFGNG